LKRKRIRKPIKRLEEDINLLTDLVENPEKFGAYIMVMKVKNQKYKLPTNINLLDFKIKMEKEVIKTAWKIERILGFELPDGIKRT